MLVLETMVTKLHDLPISDRIKLVEDIWDSIAAEQDQLPLTAPQRGELDKRLDAFEFDGEPGQPAEAVLESIRRAL